MTNSIIHQTLQKSFLALDVIAISLIIILFLAIWFVNHYFLQYWLAINMIIIGLIIFIFPFVNKYFDKIEISLNQNIIFHILFENELFRKIIVFATIIFFFNNIFIIPSYFLLIKRRYNTFFSIAIWQKNLWKIIFIPILYIISGSLFLAFFTFVDKETKEQSFFYHSLKITKTKDLLTNKQKLNHEDFPSLKETHDTLIFLMADNTENNKKEKFLNWKKNNKEYLYKFYSDIEKHKDQRLLMTKLFKKLEETPDTITNSEYSYLYKAFDSVFKNVFIKFFNLNL